MSASKPFAYLNQKPLLSDLCEHVRTERWYMLGIQLDIDTVCLNDIQIENQSEGKRRSKLFEEWLRVNPEASVGQLIEALRKQSVKENVIAHKIDMIYQSRYIRGNQLGFHTIYIYIWVLSLCILISQNKEKSSTL